MRITKVYTRTGDAGKTRLAGGQQVWKDSLRVEAYGMVDELNAMVGVVRAFNADVVGKHASAAHLDEELRWIQNKLLDAGAILATVPGQVFKNMPQITAKDVTRMEHMIDTCQKDLAPLKEFILPGGGKVPALLHQARTVCRGAERETVRLSREEPVDAAILKFLNRLSDALFVLAGNETARPREGGRSRRPRTSSRGSRNGLGRGQERHRCRPLSAPGPEGSPSGALQGAEHVLELLCHGGWRGDWTGAGSAGRSLWPGAACRYESHPAQAGVRPMRAGDRARESLGEIRGPSVPGANP